MHIKDISQNYWQMTCILSLLWGAPGIMFGEHLANLYNPTIAIIAILIGNLFLWLMGLVMIAMTYTSRSNTIQNIKDYLGNIPSWTFAIVLILAILTWFTFQLKAVTSIFDNLFQSQSFWTNDTSLKLGAFLGCIISLLSIGGIRLIKWICVILFPVISLYILYSLLVAESVEILNSNSLHAISLTSILYPTALIFASALPGIVNISIFFRHARSKQDAFFALSIKTVILSLFQISGIWIKFLNFSKSSLVLTNNGWTLDLVLFIFFIISTLVCVNLVNIYFASASFEIAQPQSAISSKIYPLIGLSGTLLYGIIQLSEIMEFIEWLTNSYISVLGVSFLLAYLIELIVKHRPRKFQKLLNSVSLFLGCSVATFILFITKDQMKAITGGVCSNFLFFLIVIFIEETVWSMCHLPKKNEGTNHK